MRSFKHWTARYVVNRVALMAYERLHPNAPWLTREMASILESWLRATDVGLEFGSGRSTVWFARRVKRLTSVEHSPHWAQRVRARLTVEGLEKRVSYTITNPNPTLDEYVAVFADVHDESLDFVLVDGIYRDACARLALPKLKRGGVLIIDNANWYLPPTIPSFSPASRSTAEGCLSDTWQVALNSLSSWRGIWTSNGVTDTALWVKPAN